MRDMRKVWQKCNIDIIADSYFAFILEKLHRATGSRRVIAIADLRDAGLANLDVHWFLKFKAIRNANYPNLFKRVYIYEANWALRIVVNSIMKLLPKKYCKLFATLVFDDAKEMLGDDLPNFMGGQKNLMGIRDGKSLKEVALDNGICEASYEKMHGYLSIDNNNNDWDVRDWLDTVIYSRLQFYQG